MYQIKPSGFLSMLGYDKKFKQKNRRDLMCVYFIFNRSKSLKTFLISNNPLYVIRKQTADLETIKRRKVRIFVILL